MDTNIEMNQLDNENQRRDEKIQMNPELVNVMNNNPNYNLTKNSRPVVPVLPDYKDLVEAESQRRIVSEINENKKLNNEIPTNTSFVKPDMELIWKNLKIETKKSIKGKDSVSRKKIILDGVDGYVKSGECLAIIGSSGAGKTTLLNYLSKKTESSSLNVTGDVKLNGERVDDNLFSLISSYVMQDDILEATMTPREILLFTAKLKLALPLEEVEKRVKNMISDLNLNKCENTVIGDSIVRGVSGGERKRTSIAVELISDPKIVFLDEPTTGLDSYNAYEVIELLNNLASKGKMIIFTIHQPSSEIFYLLSKICILALGKTVFFGPKDQSMEFFEKELKLGVPEGYNPFEHFMEVTNVSIASNPDILNNYNSIFEPTENTKKEEVKIATNKEQDNYSKLMNHFSEIFNNKKKLYDYRDEETIHNFSEENKTYIKEKNISTSVFYQFAMIFGRNIIISLRNKRVFFLKMIQSIFTAFLVCILFARLSKDYSGIQDRLGVILLCITSSILNASLSTVLVCKYF
jgi:ABC-type multidrug transport system ATPase subunit